MIDLKRIVEQYPEVVDNRCKLKEILSDLYPGEKRDIYILMALYEEDIVAAIRRKIPNIPSIFSERLEADYGISQKFSQTLIILLQEALTVTSKLQSEKSHIKNKEPSKKVNPGDILNFGSYWQGKIKSDGKTPIEWRVLAVEGTRALVISKSGLDTRHFSWEKEAITWKDSSLRNWLNRRFYRDAFSESEKVQIAVTDVKAEKNPVYGTDMGSNTEDKIFLLSIQEARLYFQNENDRHCDVTAYVRANGTYSGTDSDGSEKWWLRSSGCNGNCAACVKADGSIDDRGELIFVDSLSVRPAFWLNLSAGEKNTSLPAIPASDMENRLIKAFCKVGDVLKYGAYWQGKSQSEGKTPVEWQVLTVKDDYALLISKYCLDAKPYNGEDEATTWEDCSLRNWLNGVFYRNTFSADEQVQIAVTDVNAEYNPAYNTDAGNNTKDKIFLLSIQEANAYLPYSEDRQCKVTAYAETNNAYTDEDGTRTGKWWLRSSGYNNDCAAVISTDGSINNFGNVVFSSAISVRPAFWLYVGDIQKEENVALDDGEIKPSIEDTTPRVIEKITDKRPCTVGDNLKFGSYWQGKSKAEGKTPIEWKVIEIKDNRALLISKLNLDAKPYNIERKIVTWENCTLRSWLNETFYNIAFTVDEQKQIMATVIKAENNPINGINTGNDIRDNIFLLSTMEAESVFKNNIDRECMMTSYAKARGGFSSDEKGFWWLRSSGEGQEKAVYVDTDGFIDCQGDFVDTRDASVRPALWLDLGVC